MRRLLGREQLVPDCGEVGEQDSDLALGDLVLTLSLRRCRRAGDQLGGSQQALDVFEDRALDVGSRNARDSAGVIAVAIASRLRRASAKG
jgi:hypothetical protein